MDIFTTIICALPLVIAAYVIGKGNGYGEGYGKGYATGFLHGSETGIKNTTGCLKRTLQACGATDRWIAALFRAMKHNVGEQKTPTDEQQG